VIATVAARLATAARDGETVARYGGEEFVLVLPGCPAAEARQRAEALRALCDTTPMTAHGRLLPVTISAGVAQLRPGDGIGALIDAADRALYAAKTLGRNRVEITTDPVTGGAGPGGGTGAASVPRQPVDPADLLVGQ
jgi:diguanylate cyclase (GGDEF)-like protein